MLGFAQAIDSLRRSVNPTAGAPVPVASILDGGMSSKPRYFGEWLREGARPPRRLAALLLLGALALLSATATAAPWTTAQLPGAAGKVFLLGVSCPSQSLCVATGTNNLIASSTNPTGGAPSWRFVYAGEGPWPETENWPTEAISGRQIQGVSCPSVKLCVSVTDQGDIYSSSNPTGPASSWKVAQIDGNGRNTHLFAVSCPTVSLCVGVSGKRADPGKIFTSSDPDGGPGAWQSFELGQQIEFRGISCPLQSLCVAVANDGRIITSTEPTAGPSSWRVIGAPGGPGSLQAVSCLPAPLCITGNAAGNLLVTTSPLAGASGWQEANGGGSVQITGVSCPSVSQCLAVDDNGDVLTSNDPTASASAWSFANVTPFTQATGNALFAASCPTASLCAAVGARGRILTNREPFARGPEPERKGGDPGKHGSRRPRVKIATISLPFRAQIKHHTGRAKIRFYARGGARGFLCRFDQSRFRPCRSPESYHVGVGRHVFRVRAIGTTGLRGPVAHVSFTVDPLCGPRATPPPGARSGRRQLATICS